MAGAGYKLFTTGSVLTAAEVNTYLQEQTVMVFADATARTTALSGVVAEGMLSYLKDTDVIQYYNGSSWTTVNTDQTPLTTKGDLFTYSTADARLAVGNNGDILVPDNSTSTGLRWQGNFAAGKNKIINGDFRINQRNFTSTTTAGTYGFDRWVLAGATDGTTTYSAQTFTPGTAPVAGYEAINFARVQTTGQTLTTAASTFSQRIEDVRTFANQTVTVSFWAKAASGTPKVSVELAQYFGPSGSAQVNTLIGQVTLSTSWVRYSVTAALPSISGKTIDATQNQVNCTFWLSAGSNFDARTNSLGIQTNTFDFWGVQVEAGNVATAFQTATGTLAGELAACQRYYWRSTASQSASRLNAAGSFYTSTGAYIQVFHPVTMRTAPTSLDFSGLVAYDYNSDIVITNLVLTTNCASPQASLVTATVASGGTQYRPVQLASQNTSPSPYIGMSAEL